ncbi:MAG: nucleoside-diphosphate sugar epimerase [Omnitrophica WOR_2 bacterium SM23_29]|nr:MAG: nucleoside-diphosphate sugar epimerase [Omnitrophica WOR_2 bacterium SM23_29]
MKTALITGVAGFIGSNLAEELIRRNYRIIGVDNFSQGFKRNIENLFKRPSFSFYEGDICNRDLMLEISKDVDWIIHLAAYKIPRYGNAMATLKVNIKGTENVLDAAKNNGCKVLFSSTSDIYGKNPSPPFSEDSDILLGQTNVKRWSYAVSKIYDEHLCFAYQEEYGVPIVILRYFGGYGPNQNLTWWGGPQSVFIDCALRKKPLPVHGNGKQTRSFTYVSDITEGTIAALENKDAPGQAFNIGNRREISIIELARMIWKMVNPKDEPLIEFISYRSFSGKYEDVPRRIPDTSKTSKLLNFNPKIELEEGLPITIEWQKQFIE